MLATNASRTRSRANSTRRHASESRRAARPGGPHASSSPAGVPVATIVVGVLLVVVACATIVLSSGTDENPFAASMTSPEFKGARATKAAHYDDSERTFQAASQAGTAKPPSGARTPESRAAENLSGSRRGRPDRAL